MRELKDLLRQETLERGMSEIATAIRERQVGRLNGMLEASLLSCDGEAGTVTWEFPSLPWELNIWDNIHGGAIASIFDLGLGIFAHYLSDELPVTTANMAISYLKPAPFGESFIVVAKIVSRGHRLITVTGEGYLKNSGVLAATAMGTFARIDV